MARGRIIPLNSNFCMTQFPAKIFRVNGGGEGDGSCYDARSLMHDYHLMCFILPGLFISTIKFPRGNSQDGN